jgi:hypothetical protein
MDYIINNDFSYTSVFSLNANQVLQAVLKTNDILLHNPENLYRTLDLKTTSAIVGAVYCASLAKSIEGAIVNPIEKGHPDIVPSTAATASEAELRNYPAGLEIKTTVGNVKTGSALKAGENRLNSLTGITWQAHHQEVHELMALVWDFNAKTKAFLFPMVTAVFFSSALSHDDWGAISGTTGRNTKVCGMMATGRIKMKNGWVVMHNKYNLRYNQLL